MARRATIQDVAREAGLSIATVSGVLNGTKGFARETVRNVWDIAAKLNYTPHASARALQAGGDAAAHPRTSLIMHIIARNRPFAYPLPEVDNAVSCLAAMAQQNGYFSIPYSYYQVDGFCCPPFLNGYVDGALIGTPHLEVIRIVSAKVPTVLMDVPFSAPMENVATVNGDWHDGAAVLLKRLAELGHRKIALLQPYVKQNFAEVRNIMSELQFMADWQGIQISQEYSFKADFTPDNNLELLRAFAEHVIPGIRKREVTVILAPHTDYLENLLPMLTEAGIRIPEDVSLCGPVVSVWCNPEVSAVWLDRKKIFSAALELLDNMISHKKTELWKVLLKPELRENHTLGPAFHS